MAANNSSKPRRGDATTNEDPRLAFVYQEALRGLLQQQTALESLRNRGATLIFATSFVSSLLGGLALQKGVGVWEWGAIALLFAIGVLSSLLLWPYYGLSFRFDAKDLLDDYIDGDNPATMSQMHRQLALRIRDDWHRNGKIVKRMRVTFQLALVCLLLEIIAWMIAVVR